MVSASDPLPVSATIDTTGLATDATDTNTASIVTNQTNGSQKTQIVTSGGVTVDTFGGGTQYTEGDTDASITGTAMMMEGAANTLVAAPGTAADGLLVNLGANNDISGTVTANAGTNLNTSALALESGGNLATIAAKDFATQTTLAAINTKLVSGTDIGDVTINNTTSSPVPVQPPLSGYLNVSIDQTGNNNAVDVLTIAAGNNNIGDVDVASIAAGDNNIGNVDIVSGTITTVTTLTGGGVAHDSADSGNPHKIGFKAYSPDGTTPDTAVTEGDRSDAKGDLDGRLFVNDEHPRYWSYHLNTSTAQTDTSVQASPGAGFQLVITDIQFSSGSATAINMFLEEGASTIWGPVYLEAINGRGYIWKGKKHVTAATALTITTSSSTAHSVEILGYIQAV